MKDALSDYVYGYEPGVEAGLRFTAIGIATGAVVRLGLARLLASQLIFMRVFDGAASATGVLLVLSISIAFTMWF